MTLKGHTLSCGIAILTLIGMTATAGTVTADDTVVTDSIGNRETPAANYIDEVLWVVGDEAILRSDIEMLRLQAEQEGIKWDGNPDCRIPEQIAVQKLFLHQAAIDSIEVTEAEIAQGVEQQINGWIQMIGSQEKLEEYRKMSITQMKESLHDDFKNRELTQRMRQKLVEDVKVTPAEVREYFRKMPADSIPFVPTTVEVQIITNQPRVSIEETNKIKDELRDFTKRVQEGTTSFATLARLYSEDLESARQGGELGFIGRSHLDPAFAQVAFNLNDPKKVSKIVESEFGFHIIQLIDKRGDKINCRHILRKPRVSAEAINSTLLRMDSIGNDLRNNVFTFEDGAAVISDDKDTRNNRGLMSTPTEDGMSRTSRFEMKELPTEIARIVDTLKVGQVSKAFTMINERGKTVCAIVKLKSRIDGHRAIITEDFQVMSDVMLEKMREKKVHDWIQKKIKNTYVRIDERYKDCDFEYEGWIR
ncbi:MAG: peptidylprolyl isomerase [Prevotellaceae bacterium]|nr:peptidylprolyl isomerase [Prevotellaceae bacterium]